MSAPPLRLKLRDLRVLAALSEAGSVAAAAGVLALSQSAVSKAVSELEHALGAQLLERSSRGVELTDAGRVLIERGRVIFDEVEQGWRRSRPCRTRHAAWSGSAPPSR